MKKVTVDLRTAGYFGPSCKCLEMFEDLNYRGYRINLIAKNWTTDPQDSFRYDPKIHPNDFYENLVIPTFENINYIKTDKSISRMQRMFNFIKPIFSASYFIHFDYVSMYMDGLEKRRYHQQHVDHLYNSNFSIKGIFLYLYFFLYFKIFKIFKIYPDSKGFRYRLKRDLMTENVESIIKNARKDNIPYVLISANWDDECTFEILDDRLRGILYDKMEFNSMVQYVKELDQYAKKGKLKFVLASKKAVGWEKIIESDFLDLRNFEEKGLTLSQSIYIVQEITKLSINWPSTFSIWITNCSGILHLTWRDDKDTAKWARNRLHKESVEKALKIIGVALKC